MAISATSIQALLSGVRSGIPGLVRTVTLAGSDYDAIIGNTTGGADNEAFGIAISDSFQAMVSQADLTANDDPTITENLTTVTMDGITYKVASVNVDAFGAFKILTLTAYGEYVD